jgi:hypothetical protein
MQFQIDYYQKTLVVCKDRYKKRLAITARRFTSLRIAVFYLSLQFLTRPSHAAGIFTISEILSGKFDLIRR